MPQNTPEPVENEKIDKTTITVHRSVKNELEDNLKPWSREDTWNTKLLELKARQMPPEVYEPLEALVKIAESPDIGEPLIVPSLMGQILGKLGVAIGAANSSSLLDWGVNKTIAGKVAVFASGDEKQSLILLALGSMKRLSEHHDIPELIPLMENFKDVVLEHAASAAAKLIETSE